MNEIYYDISHPSSYGSIKKLSASSGNDIKGTASWMSSQDTYTLHKPVRKKFRRNPYLVSQMDYEWQMDLMDMKQFSKENDGYKYVLVVIDIFSKYLWLARLKTKSGREIRYALKEIFENSRRKPKLIFNDKGREFLNSDVKTLLKEHSITQFTCNNPDVKCCIVERSLRTLKQKLWRYFTKLQTRKYIDILEQLAKSYNESVHSSIGIAPIHVTKANSFNVWLNLYRKAMKIHCIGPKYKVGDYVRISKEKGSFEKGYEYNWSIEVFQIARVLKKCRPVYELKDLAGDNITGHFYQEELQVIAPREIFLIDKIHKTRGKGVNRQLFVSWIGYPSKFNCWISARKAHSLN